MKYFKVDKRKSQKTQILEMLNVFYSNYKEANEKISGTGNPNMYQKGLTDTNFNHYSNLKDFILHHEIATEYEIDVAIHGKEHADKLHKKG